MTQRLFVLGGTGHTGTHLVDLALARGHRVTAFVRSPQKITRRDPRLAVIQGNPLQADEMARALADHDAVLSVLGQAPRDALRPSTRMTEFAASTVAAMKTAGVHRIAILSAAVLFPGKGLAFTFFRWLLRHHAHDLVAMEAVVCATDVEWTIARPARLVQSAQSGYRSARDALPAGGKSMSYRAVAAFLLASVERHDHVREIVGLDRGAD